MPIILQQIMYLYLSIKKYLRMLCFLGLVWSQEAYITGLIISNEDQTPIHGANIYSKKLGIGTVSQVNGRFVLGNLPHGEISFTISMIGFKDINESLVLNKNNYDLGKISMSTDTIKIKEIVVDAHHELQPHSFASNIDFIGDKYHKNLKSSLALTLDKETGLSIRSMGQATAQPVLRGYTGDRFLLTENGITAGDLSNTSIDHAISMDMASYNKIRIIRGPEALLFGSNTIGGVIDVSRQFNFESRFKKISLSALLGAESSNKSLFGNFVAYFPVDFRQQFRFSILRRNAGNQNSPNGVLDNTALSNHEVTGTYSYFGRASRSIIILEEINMNYGIPGSYEGHIDGVVSSSVATKNLLKEHNIPLIALNSVIELPIYVDGADEATKNKHLIKGGGGALTREKIVAAASKQFICIIDDTKLVPLLGNFPLPIEVIPMAQSYVAREITKLGGQPELRQDFITDNGNVILDIHNLKIENPSELENKLNQITGVVTNGLFAKRPADVLIVASDNGVIKK